MNNGFNGPIPIVDSTRPLEMTFENVIEIIFTIVFIILTIYMTVLIAKKIGKKNKVGIIVSIPVSIFLNWLLGTLLRGIYINTKYSGAVNIGETKPEYYAIFETVRNIILLLLPIIIQIIAIFIIKHSKNDKSEEFKT